VIGVLKVTPEKGASIVLALAQQLLGYFNFLVVAGDPKVREVFGTQPNVKVRLSLLDLALRDVLKFVTCRPLCALIPVFPFLGTHVHDLALRQRTDDCRWFVVSNGPFQLAHKKVT